MEDRRTSAHEAKYKQKCCVCQVRTLSKAQLAAGGPRPTVLSRERPGVTRGAYHWRRSARDGVVARPCTRSARRRRRDSRPRTNAGPERAPSLRAGEQRVGIARVRTDRSRRCRRHGATAASDGEAPGRLELTGPPLRGCRKEAAAWRAGRVSGQPSSGDMPSNASLDLRRAH